MCPWRWPVPPVRWPRYVSRSTARYRSVSCDEFVENFRPPFHFQSRDVDARLLHKLSCTAIRAFEGARNALFLPALPHHFFQLVVAGAGFCGRCFYGSGIIRVSPLSTFD